MSRKLVLCCVLLLAFASTACAETSWWGYHGSLAELSDGKSDYSNARFHHVYMRVGLEDTITSGHLSLEGTMTVNGGRYSLVENGELQEFSGQSKTFTLRPEPDTQAGSDEMDFQPFNETDGQVHFLSEADNGLNGVNVSWTFPSMTSLNGEATVPNYKTTDEQLEEYVPYIEYIRDGSNVTGFKWRVVNPSSPDVAIEPIDDVLRFRIYDVLDHTNHRLYKGSWQRKAPGEVLEGTIMLDEPVDESSIWYVVVRLRTSETDAHPLNMYQWTFLTEGNHDLEADAAHVSHAQLVNGKADYEQAGFSFIDAYLKAEMVFLEAKHFAGEGRLEVPGGGYDLNIGEGDPVNVAEGTTTSTYQLKMAPYINSIMARDMEYFPADNQGRIFNFAGNAEENISGRTIKWTFPEELNMNGEVTLPDYLTTAEQLMAGAPYIEITSEDGKITKIDYKLVNAQTMEEVTPAYNVEFNIEISRQNEMGLGIESEETSGTWELEQPVALSEVAGITAEVFRFDGTDSPVIYRWNFTPTASEIPDEPDSPDITPPASPDITPPDSPDITPPASPDITPPVSSDVGGSGGGCDSGFALAGLLAMVLFTLKRR